jgi:phosphonate transport system substrate-binding protein
MASRWLVRQLLLSCLFLTACLPAVAQTADDDATPLRFGVLSIAPPARSYADWKPFADYMAERLGRPIEVVVPRGFERMKEAIENDDVDFFYINAHVLYRLKQTDSARGVLQMINLRGSHVSNSEIFVRADSGIHSLEDLRGRRIAYISPIAAGAYLAPRAYLYEQGIESGEETEEVFTHNQSNSIYGVLLGDYDAAALCGVRYQLMSEKVNTGDLRVIGVSFEYAENLIAARPELPQALIDEFTFIGAGMIDDPEGREILRDMRPMKIQSFAPYDPAVEEITRQQMDIGRLPGDV